MMDEFLREINALVYRKWILLYDDKDIVINVDENNSDIILLENDMVLGQIIYYGQGIFELVLKKKMNNQQIFYLHFQFTYFNHAINLFTSMIECSKKATNQAVIKVLLCCSGGLTTSLFASKMQELAELEQLPYQIGATGYSFLNQVVAEYDLILLAPQMAYMITVAKEIYSDKIVALIPAQVFATNDFSGALELVGKIAGR